MGKVALIGIEVSAKVGVHRLERKIGCSLLVDVVVETSLSAPSKTDDIADAIDYAELNTVVKSVFSKEYKLLETAARAIAEAINARCKGAKEVRVSIKKLKPLGLGAVGYSMVEFVLPEDL